MADTSIQWTEKVWNVVRGCTIYSPGCLHCYAMQQAHRFDYPGGTYEGLTAPATFGARWNGKIRLVPEKLDEPLHVRKPKKWFVNSMSDLFHEDVPFEFIDRVYEMMGRCDDEGLGHVFQILTKRAERMRDYMRTRGREAWNAPRMNRGALPRNVWLGVSVENQKTADERVHHLANTQAAVKFISYEPALEYVSWKRACDLRVDWIIVGGESGPGARPFMVEWAESTVEFCRENDIACFVKQMGSQVYARSSDGEPMRMRLKDRNGGDPSEWLDGLNVREFPGIAARQSVAGER